MTMLRLANIAGGYTCFVCLEQWNIMNKRERKKKKKGLR